MPELQRRSPLGREARIVNMTELGKALTQLNDPPVKAMVVYNSNPAAIAPNQNLVLAGMRREDLFTVVLEQFQNDTADHADILLPSTTFLEHTDLYLAYGHYHLQLARPALPAPGETKSNVEVFRLAGPAHGFRRRLFRGFRRRHDPRAARFRPSVFAGNHAGAPGTRAFRAFECRARLRAVSALRARRVRHAVRQVRVRRGGARLSAAHRIAARRAGIARAFSAGIDFRQEPRQHELHLRQ